MLIQDFINEKLAEANRRFAGMTREQKAVKVAQDAIWQITSGSVRPGVTYFHFNDNLNSRYDPGCRVCAKGALFAGVMNHHKIEGEGEVAFSDQNDDQMHTTMVPHIFTPENWEEVEAAFECLIFSTEAAYNYRIKLQKRVPELRSYSSMRHVTVMLYICTNIIHNNGTFVPANDAPPEIHEQLVAQFSAAPAAV